MSLLEIKNLNVRFGDKTAVPVVDGLDLSVDKGEVLAIVGESGSGKSVTMMALMGLIEHPGIVSADSLTFDGKDMLKLSNRQRRQIVGKDLAMVFQDPMTALNPSYTVGFQIEEVLRLHLKMSGKQARKRAIELLLASDIDQLIASVRKSIQRVDSSNVGEVLELHGVLTGIFKEATCLEKRSLASKYLHFHAPDAVLIYDSVAAGNLHKISKESKFGRLGEIQNGVDAAYAKYVFRALKYRNEIFEPKIGRRVSPRELDKSLYR